MAILGLAGQTAATGHSTSKMVRIGPMASAIFLLNRRELITGLDATALCLALSSRVLAQAGPSVSLQAKTDALALRPGGHGAQVWSLVGPDLRFRRGDALDVALANFFFDQPAPSGRCTRSLHDALPTPDRQP